MMKKNIFPILILILALVIAIGSQTFLSPCVHEDGSFGSCHWAGRALLGVGVLLAAQALLAWVRTDVYLAVLPTALLGCFIPGTLISLCKMSAMRCRSVMQPAMILLCAVIAMLALIGYAVNRKSNK